MEEAHKHEFNEFKLVFVDSNSKKYNGDRKGLILKKCDCGQDTALNYGDYNVMKEEYQRLIGLVNVL